MRIRLFSVYFIFIQFDLPLQFSSTLFFRQNQCLYSFHRSAKTRTPYKGKFITQKTIVYFRFQLGLKMNTSQCKPQNGSLLVIGRPIYAITSRIINYESTYNTQANSLQVANSFMQYRPIIYPPQIWGVFSFHHSAKTRKPHEEQRITKKNDRIFQVLRFKMNTSQCEPQNGTSDKATHNVRYNIHHNKLREHLEYIIVYKYYIYVLYYLNPPRYHFHGRPTLPWFNCTVILFLFYLLLHSVFV